MSQNRIVWSDEEGDTRKKKESTTKQDRHVDESKLELKLRRLSSGKGRVVIEIKGLPKNVEWCKKLASDLKKSLGVGGAFKNDYIEIHIDNIEKVMNFCDSKQIKWKKTGG